MSRFKFDFARLWFLSAVVICAFPAQAQTASPAAPRYDSAFTGYQSQAQAETARLPWKNLFNADGSFAQTPSPEVGEVTVRKPTTSQHAGHTAGRNVTLEPPTQLAQAAPTSVPAVPAAAAPTAPASVVASDTHGTIESINKAEGKVKLKHGPIPKFDMPGMTMVFRVQDPKLLDQVKVGDKVGVTMQMTGSAIVITGFQK